MHTAVWPLISMMLMSAPAWISCLTISRFPCRLAT